MKTVEPESLFDLLAGIAVVVELGVDVKPGVALTETWEAFVGGSTAVSVFVGVAGFRSGSPFTGLLKIFGRNSSCLLSWGSPLEQPMMEPNKMITEQTWYGEKLFFMMLPPG